jgi:hypothetical protein
MKLRYGKLYMDHNEIEDFGLGKKKWLDLGNTLGCLDFIGCGHCLD